MPWDMVCFEFAGRPTALFFAARWIMQFQKSERRGNLRCRARLSLLSEELLVGSSA
jgi:hypothetical protein